GLDYPADRPSCPTTRRSQKGRAVQEASLATPCNRAHVRSLFLRQGGIGALGQHRKAPKPQRNPDEFPKAPQEGEGDARDLAITEGGEKEQVSGILRTQAARNEKRPSLDED